jgi:hypothetical protein
MKTRTKRTLISVACGVFVPILAFEGGSFIREFASTRWLADILFWIAGWPLALLKPVTPNSEDTSSQAAALRLAILVAVPLFDVLVYSFLTYFILSVCRRRRVGRPD